MLLLEPSSKRKPLQTALAIRSEYEILESELSLAYWEIWAGGTLRDWWPTNQRPDINYIQYPHANLQKSNKNTWYTFSWVGLPASLSGSQPQIYVLIVFVLPVICVLSAPTTIRVREKYHTFSDLTCSILIS